MEELYIQKHIRSVYAKKLISPIIYLIILGLLWSHFSFSAFLSPMTVDADTTAETYARSNHKYVTTTVDHLYYSGYTCVRFGHTAGYFYYTKADDTYIFYLLSPTECNDGSATLDQINITGKIVEGGYDYQILLTAMAEKLNWTYSGISDSSGAFYISTPDDRYAASMILLVLAAATGLYAILILLDCLLSICFPNLSKPCRRLGKYGKAKDLMSQAETELATLPQLATEDMFITEHFFIEISSYGIAIIPINEIVWIYKHSTLHQFTRMHINLSYTLRIYGTHKIHFDCPKNTKSDIDGIIDYLSEANHEILIGFTPENMELAKERTL